MKISVIENNRVKDGEPILFMSSNDYKAYVSELKGNECPKCGIVPAKPGGCINHLDCPFRKENRASV